MLKLILLALIAGVIVFLIVVAMQPTDFRYARTATIGAPPAIVFAQVNDLHRWEAWSPWAKMDPNAKTTYAGSAAGPGSSFTWDGNNNVGEGTMTITDSHPNDRIQIRLDFRRPFKGTNVAEFTFEPKGDQTVVTWTMTGQNNFIAKAIGLFLNCEKMIGGQFEKGLADLDTASRAASHE